MAKKRKVEEVDVSEIESSAQGAIVHGVVTELSPVKSSRKNTQVKYFTGKLSDGKKTVRLVSFDTSLRVELEKLRLASTAVRVKNCQIKPGYQVGSNEFEIITTTRSKVEVSPKKEFVLPTDLRTIDRVAVVELKELGDLAVNQHVTVLVKVLSVEEPVTVSDRKLLKQECIVADASGTSRLVLWQNDIGKLDTDTCYKLEGLTVRLFRTEKYLSFSDGAVVEEIGTIGDVADYEERPNEVQVITGEVVAVMSSEEYSSCFSCKAKVRLKL